MKFINYKTKMDRVQMEAFEKIIDVLLCSKVINYTDAMWLCLLSEIKDMLYRKFGDVKKEYKLSFTPAQAFAVFQVSLYMADVTTDMGNKLHTMRNEIRELYKYYNQ